MIGAKASTMTGILAPIAASIPDITGIVATVGITGGIMAPTPDAIMIGAGAVITTGIVVTVTEGATKVLAA